MALVYFDASALMKLVVGEDGSDLAAELWDGCDAVFASRLAYVEVRAALGALHRNGDLSDRALRSAGRGIDELWTGVRPVELSAAVATDAGRLAVAHALRGADAVHLASALAIGDPHLLVAVWDRRLSAGALAAGLAVVPDLG